MTSYAYAWVFPAYHRRFLVWLNKDRKEFNCNTANIHRRGKASRIQLLKRFSEVVYTSLCKKTLKLTQEYIV